MKFLNHNLFTGDVTVSGTTTLSTATGVTRAASDNSTHLATTAFVKAQGYSTTDSYVSSVSLNGNSLDFTGTNSAFTGSIDLSSISATSVVKTVYETVKNASGAIIYKGTPLAVVSGQTEGNVSDVVPADAAIPARMPAVFIANEDIADEAEGEAVLFGYLSGVDTSAYQSGTTVYVAPGGGWTATKPIYPNKIQNLGVITKQHATNGAGIVTGVGRANDLPNLTTGKIWVGTANYPIESTTVHIDETSGRLGIGTTSPGAKLAVHGISDWSQGIRAQGTSTNGVGLGLINDAGKNWFFISTGSSNGGGANNLGIYEQGGDYRMYIKSGGNVGIGTTAPAYNLDVQSPTNGIIRAYGDSIGRLSLQNSTRHYSLSVQGSSFYLYDEVGAATRILINSLGNVGIGTDSPLQKLDVRGSTYISGYIVGFDTNPQGNYAYRLTNDGGNSYLNLQGGNVGIGTTSPSEKLEVTGNIIRVNSNAGGFYQYNTAGLFRSAFYDDGSVTSIYADGNGSTPVMTFNAGNVGIGTTSPNSRLHVYGGHLRVEGSATDQYYLEGTRTGVGTTIRIYDNANTAYIDSYNNMAFRANQNGGSGGSFRFTGGNVGIGTTSPTAKLHINAATGDGLKITTADVATIKMGSTSGGTSYWGFATTNLAASDFGIYQSNSAGGDPITAGTPRLYFKSDGNVGIGTTSPGARLTIAGGSLGSLPNNSLGISAGLATGRLVGNYGVNLACIYNEFNDDTIEISAGQSSGYVSGIVISPRGATGDVVDALTFYTRSAERMRIDASGNVGIGTTNPSYKFQVQGTNGFFGVGSTGNDLYFSRNGANYFWGMQAGSSFKFYIGGSEQLSIGSGDAYFTGNASFCTSLSSGLVVIKGVTRHTNTGENKKIEFWRTGGNQMSLNHSASAIYFNNDQTSTSLLVMQNGGNVGIGTTTPAEKLHVVGKVKIDNGSTSATLETTNKVADPAGAVYATYPVSSTYGAFVDYVIYDSGRDSMRVGTMRATWNANEVVYADASTVDIGDTSVVTMTAVLNGTDVDLVVTGDAVFTVKLNVKVIR